MHPAVSEDFYRSFRRPVVFEYKSPNRVGAKQVLSYSESASPFSVTDVLTGTGLISD